MKRQFKVNLVMISLLATFLLTSCLKKGLPELPLFKTAEITLVNAEYRFNSSKIMYGNPVVAYQKLNLSSQIDTVNSSIAVQITVPEPNGEFTTQEKAKVVQTKLWFYMNISTAATIKAVEGTPALGDPSDATKPLKYEVTAANGRKRIWTVNITSFLND